MTRKKPAPFPLLAIALSFLGLLAVAGSARAWEVRSTVPASVFEDFHRRFATAAYAYPRHGAVPLGVIGWQVYADASYDQKFDEQGFVPSAIQGDFTGGALAVGRVGARKGLPGGFDLGLSYGRALGGDIELVSGEVQWAWLHGGALEPAVAFRLTGTRTLDPGPYRLEQLGAEVLVSKGFAVLTPFMGAGVVRSRGRLERDAGAPPSLGGDLESTETQPVLFAGATLNLLLPKITLELEKGEAVQASLRIALGF